MSFSIFQLTTEETQPFEEKIKDNKCGWCNVDLSAVPISGYPHSAGWKVEDHAHKMWLFKTCPKCGYDWALWKLGVHRE